MTKTEMKKAANNELIVAYVEAYSSFVLKYNEKGRGIKMIQKECQNLEAELLKRELLTEEDVRRLNM